MIGKQINKYLKTCLIAFFCMLVLSSVITPALGTEIYCSYNHKMENLGNNTYTCKRCQLTYYLSVTPPSANEKIIFVYPESNATIIEREVIKEVPVEVIKEVETIRIVKEVDYNYSIVAILLLTVVLLIIGIFVLLVRRT